MVLNSDLTQNAMATTENLISRTMGLCVYYLHWYFSSLLPRPRSPVTQNLTRVLATRSTLDVVLLVLFMLMGAFLMQVSAIEQDIIEVDPDTKEMLKVLVSDCSDIMYVHCLPSKTACKGYHP